MLSFIPFNVIIIVLNAWRFLKGKDTIVHYNEYLIQFKKYVFAQLKYVLKIMSGKGNSDK